MSADGKIASPQGKQIRISSDKDIKRMYNLRNNSDAVLVGINTVLSDDPKLTVKEKYVKNPNNPVRIVLDSNCRTPVDSKVVNDKSKTFIVVKKGINCVKKYDFNVEIVFCETNKDGLIDLKYLMKKLSQKEINTLMVEGGGEVIWSFLKEKLVDDLYVYVAPMIIGGKKTPTIAAGEGIKDIDDIIKLEIVESLRLGEGFLFHYKPVK
jgi:2,5-diamino-6-(ribosylamino)-4(3H)-pyrimidinone 5'-phosphate reductase